MPLFDRTRPLFLSRHRYVSLTPLALGALLAASPAWAQQTAPQTPAPATTAAPVTEQDPGHDRCTPATVSVTTKRNSNRIDRQVYDVKADPASTNDTVADTLNKVPSVAVDADGQVTLRGKSNVQIYVDGKPSAMMQGENRAAAINALPAGDLESVEVINNPGAQFGNEGGGGPILNLVMRRERTPGGFAAINANAGTEGRFNVGQFRQLYDRPLECAGRAVRPPRQARLDRRDGARSHRSGHRRRGAQHLVLEQRQREPLGGHERFAEL